MISKQQLRRLIAGVAVRQVHPNAMREPYVAEMAAEQWLATAVLDRYAAAGYAVQAEDPSYETAPPRGRRTVGRMSILPAHYPGIVFSCTATSPLPADSTPIPARLPSVKLPSRTALACII